MYAEIFCASVSMIGSAVREPTQLLAQVRRPFEQPCMNVEDITRKRLTAGRPPQQKRQLAIGTRVMRQVVVDDQHVAALRHEMLRDTGRGVGGNECQTRRVVALGHDEYGIRHCALFPQGGHGFRDGGGTLPDGAVNAQYILVALIKDGVDRNGSLAGLAVAKNQLALTPPHGNERVNDLQSGLKRDGYRRTIHNVRRGPLDRQPHAAGHRSAAIEWSTQRVDDAPQQSVAHGHIHDPSCALNFVAGVQVPVFAEEHDTNLPLVHIERHAEQIAGKFHQLLKSN